MGTKSLSDFPDVSFIEDMTVEEIKEYYMSAMKEKYRELTGEELVLHEADPIKLVAHADCLLLYQIAQYAERAGKMALLKYSYGDYLENIGALKGIYRIQGAAAKTKLRFTLSANRLGTTIIPAGTRVTASDGVYFSTMEILEIPAGIISGEVSAECRDIGSKGNGYLPGELKVLVDPIPYIDRVENIAVTEGGADLESDENLAERIYLAPSSWSTAGPDDAYKYWVLTYDPSITDVEIRSDIPGVVNICFILQDGNLPAETMLEAIAKYLKDKEIRPLTDNVIVEAPEIEEYEVDLTYYINRSDRTRASLIQEQVQKAVAEYTAWQRAKIGRDINPDKLREMMMAAGVKRMDIRAPDFRKISKASIALPAQDLSVLYGGVEDD